MCEMFSACLFAVILTLHTVAGLQHETKVLEKGQDIELSCEDDVPIHWCYPQLYTNRDDPGGAEYPSAPSETYSQGNKYKATLKITKVIYRYTGYYHCVRNESDVTCNRNMDNARSTYIYVKDPDHPLIVHGLRHLTAYRNESLTLPCFPTDPKIGVQLHKGYTPVELGKQSDSNLTVEYDSTLGFTLWPFTTRDLDEYGCNVEAYSKNSFLDFYITVEARITHLMTPSFMKDSNFIKSSFTAREGSTLKLVCRSLQNKDVSSVSFEWNIPNQKRGPMETKSSTCQDLTHKCTDNELTLKNITAADSGNYSCTLNSQKLRSAVKIVQLDVIGENDTGVTISSLWDPKIPVPKGTDPMKIVVDYTSPENISVVWYGPDDKPLETNSNKYMVQVKPSQTLLYVKNVSLRDAGPYKVYISDKTDVGVWFNTSVVIQGKPEVNVKSPSILFNPGKRVTFSCEVYSAAPVDVTWSFTKCDLSDDRKCVGSAADVINKTSIKSFERVYVLNVTLNNMQEGVLRCVANNTCTNICGSSNASQKIYLTELEELNQTLSIIDEPEEIVTGSNLTLTCAGSAYFFQSFPSWHMYDKNVGNQQKLHNSSDFLILTSRSDYTVFSNLTFRNVSKYFNERYVDCEVENSPDNVPNSKVDPMYLNVKDPEFPTITATNLNKDIEVKISEQTEPTILYCKTKGVPKPRLTWLKDGVVVKTDIRFRINEKNQSLIIRTVVPDDEGMYSCEAQSSVGKVERKAQLVITDKPGPISVGLLVTILILVPLLLGLLIFLVVKIRKERKLQRELNLAGLANFEKGAMENINPELPVDEQADLLPYDKTWEFPVERLKLGKMLGAGAFGVVMRAEAYGILDNEEKTTVAVKMVKSGADTSYIRALASELKIMIHLGKHLNVVNLLGASTKRLNKMELMVIVEFCRFGNLHNYLIRHRDDFVDQVDHSTGEINLAIGMDKLARSPSTKSKTTLKHRLLSYSSSLIGANNSASSNAEAPPPASPVGVVASDMSVVSSPSGEPDECLLSSSSGDQPVWRVKYGGDYRDASMTVCTQNLLCWAFQIARGMEYLASRKVLHGDLAARNVLLADENIVKICDFGLARSMYKSDNYKKKGGGPLPVKWMALESIRDHIFSTQSDVWSFGIVLWELFSLARTPYPGMEANERLLEKLLNGYRMEQPTYSPHAIYKTMLKCWHEKPNTRPSFTELAEELGAMLDDNLRRHFEELNDPYVDMNEQRQSSNDYLGMMGSPNYRNLMSPISADREYVNSPHPSGSDYLNMKSPTSPASGNGSVFEYTPEDAGESGYLRMSAKDSIFSPRHMSENPFKFTPTNGNSKEALPMKVMQSPNSDNYVNVGTSVSNPTYVMT